MGSIMQPGRRYFTYQLAMDLLPEVVLLLESARDAKLARHKAQADLAAYKKRLVMAGGAFPNQNRLAAYADLAKTSHDGLKRAVEQLEELGIEVRDIEKGLIDFPAMYQGQPVYLCFQLGEKSITHWHPADEGFEGRRPISQDFVDQLDAGLS
jgi:hypothetical protein